MGLISNAVSSAFEGMGSALMDVGKWGMKGGYKVWVGCGKIAVEYAKKDPSAMTNAWGTVTGNIFNIMLSVGSALAVLYFVIGWLNESIDIRTNFTLESMFRFFVRYIITASLIVNSLTLATGIVQCTTALTAAVSAEVTADSPDDVFDNIKEDLEDDEADGGTWLACGLIAMLGGIIGGLVIIVCGIEVVVATMSRLFKLLLCIPFAPLAFAGFAGGRELSQSGIAWLRTFTGYCLESLVIVLALAIATSLFHDAPSLGEADSAVGTILAICNYCLPMITAAACVKGADTVVRRCLGLG